MGGRGATRFTPKLPKGGGRSGQSSGVIWRNETLKEALGKKGKPESMAEAAATVNPAYSRNYEEYQINCQRCVVAYELNRRGYDVEALPNHGDKWDEVVPVSLKSGNIEGRWKGAFKGAKTVNVGANNAAEVQANIERQMAQWGDGARAVVQVFWKGGGGHVYNAENTGTGVHYIDAQHPNSHVRNYLQEARPSKVMLIRTDNLRISDRAKYFVKPAQK